MFFYSHLEQTRYDSSKDLYFMKVKEWPHLKLMCLNVLPPTMHSGNIYRARQELFEYELIHFQYFAHPLACWRQFSRVGAWNELNFQNIPRVAHETLATHLPTTDHDLTPSLTPVNL
ncbi:hypothetical protein TNCT_348421 [Trichonephila clavata]|uniref:Uncharacterized protein n=1 Tax=Trichonephila clavata TaxID=2740835 RepID=A0A8X6LKN5_TRICU|nr:hypothetical protein TNCT_348421 [Trichonephila clavata]